MSSLTQRCLAFYQQQGRDAMLRQGDPVQAIYDFVLSEISRAADSKLDDKEALVLYFKTPEDRAEFVAAIMEAKPNMISRKWPR